MTEVIDLVCGMDLSGLNDTRQKNIDGETFRFCSDYCLQRFFANPKKFQGQPIIELRAVKKIFDLGKVKVEALRGLSARIWEGDFTAIIGASGSGKSTALYIIGLLDEATEGRVLLGGRDVAALSDDEKSRLRSETFGFVFQQYNLIPWLSAFDNVRLPSAFSGKPTDAQSVLKILDEVGLGERIKHRPVEMSGGEQQRVSLARALTNDPKIILADEPTGNLDSATGNKILEMLMTLQRVHKKTLIVVTHDRDIAANADQVLILRDGVLMRDHHAQLHKLTE